MEELVKLADKLLVDVVVEVEAMVFKPLLLLEILLILMEHLDLVLVTIGLLVAALVVDQITLEVLVEEVVLGEPMVPLILEEEAQQVLLEDLVLFL